MMVTAVQTCLSIPMKESRQLPLEQCRREPVRRETLPRSSLELLPDELLLKILNYVMAEETPFGLEDCIDCARSGQRVKRAKFSQLWHQTHLTDWILINATCHRFRGLGWEAFFTSKTVFASQSLNDKLVVPEEDALWSPTSRPLFHSSLLHYVRDLVVAPVNIQCESVFLKIPQFLASFANLRTCTLQLSYRQGDPIDYIRNRTPLAEARMPWGGTGRDTGRELKRRFVALGVSERIDLKLALCPHLGMTNSWYENILERNVFPMLDLRIDLLRMR